MTAPFRLPPCSEAHERELRTLRAENRVLRDKLEFFEATVFGDELLFPREWRLTPSETRLLGLLLSMPLARREAIMTAMYRDATDDAPGIKIIDVWICHLRRKLKPSGVIIRCVWGVGYVIDEPHRGWLRAACLTGDPAERRRPERAAIPSAPPHTLSPPSRMASPGGR